MSVRSLALVFAAAAALSLAATSGCAGCAPPVAPDQDAGAGEAPDAGEKPDAGVDAGVSDAGPKPDAGPVFKQGYADEPCPDASYDFEPPDGGFPDGTVIRGLCIALTELSGTATIDGAPVQAPIHLTFDGFEYRSQLERPADGNGAYSARVMRAKYQRLLYRPTEILNHSGSRDLGQVDLRKDQTRNLSVKTWIVAGAAFFAGLPWPASVNPPDTTLHAEGAPSQVAWTTNVGGGYQVRLMEGDVVFRVSVPLSVLGETRLMEYPLTQWVNLRGDLTLDIDLPTSELSGTFTVDGQPFPDRAPNQPDYHLLYAKQGDGQPSVSTVHEGGSSFFSALVPKGTYAVDLELTDVADSSLPALLYNKQLAVGLDLSQNQTLTFNLTTHALEGAIAVDGVPVTPNNSQWILYAFAYDQPAQPWFLAYYRVPFTSSAFSLRAPPGEYYLAIYLDPNLHPEFPTGYYEIDAQRPVYTDVSLPIDIPTALLTGTLSIDGALAASDHTYVGTLVFDSPKGTFRHKVHTTDGTFVVRLPQLEYKVSFEVNPEAYPDYAEGRQPLDVTLDMTAPRFVELSYETVPVAGPLLMAGEPVPDADPVFPEVELGLRSIKGARTFSKPLHGGRPYYFMRVPRNDYELEFELKEGVLEDVAYGTAPIGNDLLLDVR